MVKSFVVQVWFYLVIAFVVPASAELSKEAQVFAKRLLNSGEAVTFQEFEDWVFKEGLNEEERKVRIGEALKALPHSWDHSPHVLRYEGFQKRLVRKFPGNWWAWKAAAELIGQVPSRAVLGEGGFERRMGWNSGTHNLVAHDEILQIQFLEKAAELAIAADVSGDELAEIYISLAGDLQWLSGDGNSVLTDLVNLPEPDATEYRQRYGGSTMLDGDGQMRLPKERGSLEEAKTDYERALWYLLEAEKIAKKKAVVKYEIADFWADLLGVNQVAYAGYLYIEGTESEYDPSSTGEFELHTLKDRETLLVGEDGPRRVTLPERCQFIRMKREVIEDETAPAEFRWRAAQDLVDYVYPNRRQFEKALKLAKWMNRLRSEDKNADRDDEVDFDMEHLGPSAELNDRDFFVAGVKPEVTLYSRGLDVVELELWKLDPSQLAESSNYNTVEEMACMLHSVSLRNSDYEGRDLRKENEWFEDCYDEVERWRVEVKKKPNLLQTRTVIELPVKEPGNYVVVYRDEDGLELLPLQICDVAILSGGSVGPGRKGKVASLYAVDPATGQPLEGVELKQQGWGEDYEFAISDHTGCFHDLREGDDSFWRGSVLVRRPNSAWLLVRKPDQGGQTLWGQDQQWQSFLVTNQPLYRPGQKVSLAGWLREVPRWTDREVKIFEGMPLRMRVTDPTGREVWSGETKLDEFGGFTGEFQLEDEVVLGNYRVDLIQKKEVRDSDPFSDPVFEWKEIGPTDWRRRSWRFEVGEFRKPDFQVSIEPVEGGDDFEVVVVATYLSGEPVRGASVVGGLKGTPDLVRFHPKRRWDDLFGMGYQWGLPLPRHIEGWKNWAMWREGEAWDDYDGQDYSVVSKTSGVTDENGRARLHFESDFPFLDQYAYRIGLKVGVIEMSGRRMGARESWTLTGRPFEVFARPLRGFYRSGEKVEVEVGAVNAEGAPQEGEGVLKIERIVDGNFLPVLKRKVRVDQSGSALVSFEAPAGGQYRCVFEGGGSGRGFVLEIVGEGGTPGKYDGLQILPRDFLIQKEGKLEVLVRTDEPSAEVWIFESVPEGWQRTPRRVKTRNHTALVELQVHPSQRPNFFVEALTFFEGKPVSRSCRVLFPDEASRLEVSMELDPEKGTPGGQAVVDLKVSDHEGGPAEAALALTVFDRSLEDLSRELKSTAMLRKDFSNPSGTSNSMAGRRRQESMFQGMWEPGVFSEHGDLEGKVERRKDSYFVKIGRDLWNGYHPPELPNQGSPGFPMTPATPVTFQFAREQELSDEEFGLIDQVKARSNFADQAYWGGALRTGEDGRLQVDFQLPDNLTSWRVQSWAFGKRRSFGDMKLELPVSKKFQVRPMMPRAAVVGDELVIGAMVQNLSKEDDIFLLKLEVEGVTVKDPGAREVALKRGEEGLAQWRVVLEKPGGLVFEVKGRGRQSGLADGFVHRVPVATREVQQTVSDSVFSKGGEEGVRLELAADQGMQGREMSVRVQAHPAVGALMVLPDLVNYPHGCVEQTLNRFLPLMVAAKAKEQLGFDWEGLSRVIRKRSDSYGWIRGRAAESTVRLHADLDDKKVQDMIEVGIHRLGELQKRDGSWGWFSADDPETRVDLTALAVRGLVMAESRLGGEKRSFKVRRGVEWLEEWSEMEVTGDLSQKTMAELSYVAWVLREAKSEKVGDLVKKLMPLRKKLPLTSQIQLCLAMEDSPEREVLEGEIRKAMKGPQLQLNPSGKWWGERVERRAHYLKMLVEVGADEVELENEVEKILMARIDGVRWQSTRESGICVEAIIEASLIAGKSVSVGDGLLKVSIKGLGEKRNVSLTAENLWSEMVKIPVQKEELNEGQNLVLDFEGQDGRKFYAAASISFASTDPKVMHEEEAGIKLERRCYRILPDQQRVLLEKDEVLEVGEVVEIELEISSGQPREFLHLRDPIPAGLEPLMQLSGYHQGAYRESRTGESHFFISELSEWNRTQCYRLSVVTEGTCLALPAQVECMYSPEIRGRANLRVVRVKR